MSFYEWVLDPWATIYQAAQAGERHPQPYDEQVYGGEKWENERHKGLCIVVRSRSGSSDGGACL